METISVQHKQSPVSKEKQYVKEDNFQLALLKHLSKTSETEQRRNGDKIKNILTYLSKSNTYSKYDSCNNLGINSYYPKY